jgi:hypothetical protein
MAVFIGAYMKWLLLIFVGWICYYFGQQSVVQTPPRCEDQRLALVASQVNDREVVCVYVEPWQIKGKTKRTVNDIQKKTT